MYICDWSSDVCSSDLKFVENVYAYPTTYVVDRSGSIVGEPIVGAVTGKSQMEKLKPLIDQDRKSVV